VLSALQRMKRIFFGLLPFGFWLVALSFGTCGAQIREEPWEPEAQNWLNVSSPVDFFREIHSQGGRSFLSQHEAERLILKLYDAGALFIGVIFLNAEPQGFRITLPLDTFRREAIFEVLNKTLERSQFTALRDTGQDDIQFWITKDSYE
jgi:hypothetical protein